MVAQAKKSVIQHKDDDRVTQSVAVKVQAAHRKEVWGSKHLFILLLWINVSIMMPILLCGHFHV